MVARPGKFRAVPPSPEPSRALLYLRIHPRVPKLVAIRPPDARSTSRRHGRRPAHSRHSFECGPGRNEIFLRFVNERLVTGDRTPELVGCPADGPSRASLSGGGGGSSRVPASVRPFGVSFGLIPLECVADNAEQILYKGVQVLRRIF